MRVRVDLENDALYFRLSEKPIEESEEISPGIILDYNKDGNVVGIEILGIKKRFSMEELSTLKAEIPVVA
jgi:Uncharacterized conserved small protein